MSTFTYTGKRSMIASHTLGGTFKIELPLSKADIDPNTRGVQNKSQGGQTETIVWGRELAWLIETQPLPESRRLAVEEFIYSVDEGEVFLFDRFGTKTTPKTPINVKKEPLGFTHNRHGSRFFSIGFRIVEQ